MIGPSLSLGLLGQYGGLEEARKRLAWANVKSIYGTDDKIDCDGRRIRWSEYGKMTDLGWEIDHIQPTILGGLDHHTNLRARHYRGNRAAGGILGGLLGLGASRDGR